MTVELLKLINLSKTFLVGSRQLHAIHRLSLTINQNEVLGLIGESGCGKSTVGKLIMRLMDATSGQIIFKNQDITKLASYSLKDLRRQIQIVFQNPSTALNPRLTIREVLEEPLDIHRLATGSQQRIRRLQELMEMVGLPNRLLGRLPQELSGGQKQRIGIARALAVEPQLLICDEPLSSLDVSVQAQIINLLKSLKKELNLTILFISHDLSVTRYFADRVAVMYLGQLMELAPTPLLFQTPRHPYTQALLSAVLVPDPAIESYRSRIILKGELPSPFEVPKGCPFYNRCPKAQLSCQQMLPAWENVGQDHMTACPYELI